MSTERQDRGEMLEQGGSDELFEQLFKHASPRPRPPEADEHYLREVIHAEWDEVVGRRVARRRMTWIAAAASVLVVIGSLTVAFRTGVNTQPAMVVATIERVLSEIRVKSAEGDEWRVENEIGTNLYNGQAISVPPGGGLALQLASGGSLRLDEKSRVELVSADRVKLLEGDLYFDSRTNDRNRALVSIETPLGAIRNIGTQFAAHLNRQRLHVRVREGEIRIDQDTGVVAAAAGEKVTVSTTGDVGRGVTLIYGDDWRWAEGLVPTFELEGRTCIDFLNWVARETGRRLEFDSPEARRVASEGTVHGSVTVEPLSSLGYVLSTCDLDSHVEGETIYIRLKRDAGDQEQRAKGIITAGEAANEP